MAETWLINESPDVSTARNFTANFTSNNKQFRMLNIVTGLATYGNAIIYISVDSSDTIMVFATNTTAYITEYRTVTFDEPVTGDLLTWFNSPAHDGVSPNAVKQTPPTTKLTFDLSTLDLPTGTYNVKVLPKGDGVNYRDADLAECVAVGYTVLPQLDAPTNLTADGTTISFDEVENAESYEVFADGVSIGEYTPVSGYTITLTFANSATTARVRVKINGEEQTWNVGETKVYTNVATLYIGEVGIGSIALSNETGSLLNFIADTDLQITSDGSATVEWVNIG